MKSPQTQNEAAEAFVSVLPYRLFEVRLLRKTVLSPHLCRLTFTGDDIDMMCTGAPDQRIKVFFSKGTATCET